MNRTELLDKFSRDAEERLLLSRVQDRLEMARRRNTLSATTFLSPGEQAAVRPLLAAQGQPRHLFYGGYEGAERCLCLFLPDWLEEGDALSQAPLSALRCHFPGGSKLSHRDFLGSLLALGITRERLGDILPGEESCDVLLLPELEDFLLQNWTSAGRVSLRVESIAPGAVALPERTVKTIRDTVATTRLDAVLASGFSLSRGRASELIAAGRVQLNYRDCLKGDKLLSEGDVISCRGLGKCRLAVLGGLSRKGRQTIVLERYV